MQTIIGSGGAIGVLLASELQSYSNKIRLVSRNPQKVNPDDELFAADVLNRDQLKKAIEGSDIVYVTVGFKYEYKTWKENWPAFISNVVDLCIEQNCKLVFFDNVYMYDENHLNGMTEDTTIDPPSKKGQIRAQIAKMIMDKVKEGKLKALIARSADFYGPGIKNASVLTEMVFNPFNAGKKANWMGSVKHKHSFTYTPDAGKATALLGNTDSAYNQVWHLPTAGDPPTGKEWLETIAREMGVKPKYRLASKFMVRVLGLFSPIMREMVEMVYQYDRDYVLNSDKFEKQFGMKPTPYIEGVREIIKRDYKG